MRIGRFGTSDTDILFQEVIEGNLIYCLQETLSVLARKFLIKPIHFEGILRIEEDQYPLSALRETLLNALVHRRYQSGVHVQIRVYDDRLVIWNAGPLPEEITLETLLGQHASYPRNPLIADACFKAGYIDAWGRGIEKISSAFSEANLPAPKFEENSGGIRVTLTSRINKGDNNASREVTAPVNEYVQRLLVLLAKNGPQSNAEILESFQLKSRRRLRETYIHPALTTKLIEPTIPDKPTNRLQKYRLTAKGKGYTL